MRRLRAILRFGALGLLLTACERDEPIADPIDLTTSFGSGAVQIVTAQDTLHLDVQIAESEAQRSVGLMRRTSLAPDSGMVFIFEAEQPAEGVFWMYNTLIPLDIAFIGEDRRIGSIHHMEPCASPYPQWCPNYASGVPFRWALEVNAGYFAAEGVSVGDEVILQRE